MTTNISSYIYIQAYKHLHLVRWNYIYNVYIYIYIYNLSKTSLSQVLKPFIADEIKLLKNFISTFRGAAPLSRIRSPKKLSSCWGSWSHIIKISSKKRNHGEGQNLHEDRKFLSQLSINIHIHTHIHTYIHTYIHIYIYV